MANEKKVVYGVLNSKGVLIYVDADKTKAEKVAGPTDEVVPMEKVDNKTEK